MTETDRRRGDWPRRPVVTADEARDDGRRELFEQLEALLVETRGNIAEVARRLGKDRSTVRYHLARFGMLGRGRRVSRPRGGARVDGGAEPHAQGGAEQSASVPRCGEREGRVGGRSDGGRGA